MEELRASLLQRAFCYDDPAAYCAGVDAALAAVSEALTASTSPRDTSTDAEAAAVRHG